MKYRLLPLAAALALASSARADYTPIPLTPETFTADVIVENTAPPRPNSYVTATMDGGTNVSSRTFFEQGFITNMPTLGLPPAGTVFTAEADASHQFQMPASYTAPNALFINSQVPSGRLTLTTPTALSAISILGSSAGSDVVMNFTINFADNSTLGGTLTCPDWFNKTPVAWTAKGRYSLDNHQFDNLYSTNPRIYYMDLLGILDTSPVTSIDFTYVSGSGRSCLLGLSGLPSGGSMYTPLAVTGFTRDMIIEAAAPHLYGSLYTATTASMDAGTNNTANTYYEQGLNTGTPTSGLPHPGTTFTASGAANHSFTMPASYTANNALLITAPVPTGTLTLNTPTALTAVSILSGSGNGPVTLNYTVYYQDGNSTGGTFDSPDWHGTSDATTAWICNGRFNLDAPGFNSVGSSPQVPRMHFSDLVLPTTTSPVTRIDFTFADTSGRTAIFGLSGQATAGGNFTPLAVSGFSHDVVVENVSPVTLYTQPSRLTGYTTVSMDGGTNNTGNTWYERGFYATFPNSGLPAAGSTITSLDLPDHQYQMPANYAANNCVYVDQANPIANVTPVTPAWYSALSFLSATANNSVTNQCIMQYSDGSSETNVFESRDWFDKTPYAFTARGRVQLNNGSLNNDPARTTTPNPRLYEAQFALNAPPSALLTNVVLTFVGAVNPTTARMVVLAVSGTTGEVAPIVRDQPPASILTMEGSNVVVSVTMGGGTPPFTYQWQMDTGGGFVDVADGGTISGANSTALTFTSIVWTNAAQYRIIASGPSLSTTSAVCTLTVRSGLPDVTQPGDPIVSFGGTSPAAESVDHAIENLTSKYLNNGSGAVPFGGPGGFVVTPLLGGSVINVLRFYTANDADSRDPADFKLEGSNDGGANYTDIASGPLALPGGRNEGGAPINPLTQNLQEIRFVNTASYTSYRVSFATVKGASEALLQIGEVELLGVANPQSVPTVVVPPANTTVNEGTTATFSVTAFGVGTLNYTWYDVTGGEPGTQVGGNAPTLTLANVTAAMNGNTYRVVVANAYGATASPAFPLPGAQLSVLSGAPAVQTDLPTEALVLVGRTTVMPVTIAGTEPFTLQWQKDSANLSDSARITGAHSNVLTITDARLDDAGNYQLAIHNIHGDAQSGVEALTVQKIPAFTDTGLGWTLNGYRGANAFPATMLGGILELTAGSMDTRRSAWYNFPLYVGAFKASFTYQDATSGGGGADGIAFVVQNAPEGTSALGGGGGGLGYLGMTNSAALQFNIFGAAGIAFNTNGNTGGYVPTTPVNIASGDPIRVEITYTAGTAHLALSNTVTAATFVADLPVGSLPATVGTDTAWVGFTGADGGVASVQYVTDFSYIAVPSLTAQTVGGSVVLSWPASIGGYQIESALSLTSPTWVDAGLTPVLVGDQYEATVVAPAGDKFYRLVITP